MERYHNPRKIAFNKMPIKKPKVIYIDEEKENKILKRWVTRNYGKRCPDYEKDCACCKAWKCYDYLVME